MAIKSYVLVHKINEKRVKLMETEEERAPGQMLVDNFSIFLHIREARVSLQTFYTVPAIIAKRLRDS